MTIPGSIFAAMLTPFRDDGSVAPERIGALVDYILSKGVDGLYAGGSTGECILLSRAERSEILQALASEARGRCSLVAHVGAASTGDAVALARIAGRAGYDAVSAIPPYYYKYTFAEITDYYAAIADASGLPLVIYNIPALTGVELATDQLLDLLRDSRVGGIKFTDKDVFQFSRLRQAVPEKRFYFGTDEMFICAAAAGTDGGIGSTYNLIGDVYVGIRPAVEEGDIATARMLQAKANDLIGILLQTGVIPGLKHAMNRLDVPVGACRRPFRPPPPEAIRKLETWMDGNLAAPA